MPKIKWRKGSSKQFAIKKKKNYARPNGVHILGKDSDQFSDVMDNVTSDGTMVINKVTKKHEGYYMCEASNEVGTPISAIIRLNVQGV